MVTVDTIKQQMNSDNVSIQQIEIYRSSIPLKRPFVISLGSLDVAENIFIVIRTNKGITGFGECSPFKTIHGESAQTCFVVAGELAKGLLNKNPLNTDGCCQIMDTIIFGNSSIKSAFDIALYDIASQNAGIPLYDFLGGKKNKKIVTDYTVSFGDVNQMRDDALEIKEAGFQIIKVKLGGEKSDDLERIYQIRKAIGPEIPIRIDANQGWDVPTAIEILNAAVAFNIQHCEEPIPKWNFMELPFVKQKSPIPIMADESCFDHHDAKRLIDLKACDLFNIKLGKSSGFHKAMKIVRLAEQAGIHMQVGGFLESRLGFTASAHLAYASDLIVHIDFDTPLMFTEDPVTGGISYEPGGIIRVPDQPGLGASLDEQVLKRMEKSIVN